MKTSTLAANKDKIIQIMQNYRIPKSGKVDWKAAAAADPTVFSDLGIKEGEDKQPLYLYVSKLRKEMNFPRILKTSSKTNDRERKRLYQKAYRDKLKNKFTQTDGVEASDNSNFSLKHVNFCPCCGTSLQAVEMAMRLTKP